MAQKISQTVKEENLFSPPTQKNLFICQCKTVKEMVA